MIDHVHEKLPVTMIFRTSLKPCYVNAICPALLREAQGFAEFRFGEIVRIKL